MPSIIATSSSGYDQSLEATSFNYVASGGFCTPAQARLTASDRDSLQKEADCHFTAIGDRFDLQILISAKLMKLLKKLDEGSSRRYKRASGWVGHVMRLPDTIIDYVETEVSQCRTLVDVEEMTKNLASRFPGVDYDRDQVTEIIVDRASARGLAVRFATT